MWFIQNITKICYPEEHLLPTAEFLLSNGQKTVYVKGWLPCHHTNVGYDLKIINKRIVQVIHLTIDKTKKNKTNVITQTARRIKQKGFCLSKTYTSDQYRDLAYKSYACEALWTCTVLYSHWELRHMNIQKYFELLSEDIEHIIRSDSPASRPRFLFQPVMKTKVLMQRALQIMGKSPYTDWEGFEARRAWYLKMQSDTGARKKPSEHVRRLECYQDLWTTSYLIEEAKNIRDAFTPENVTLIEGSPSPSNIPADARIILKSLEDVYKWKCEIDHGRLYVFSAPYKLERLRQLGVADITELDKGQTLYLPWAHTWGQKDWLKLATYNPEHVTCIGRLDQWPFGRGQIFRDMLSSKKFDTARDSHTAVDNVQMIDTNNIPDFVQQIQKKHKVVQCFSEKPDKNLDCGRRYLTKPKRIRTLRPSEGTDKLLYEERKIHFADREDGNASVVNVRTYRGLKVPAAIYLCTEETTPFHVHVARTHCRDILYVVNCKTCLFAMNKQSPVKCTINPFI